MPLPKVFIMVWKTSLMESVSTDYNPCPQPTFFTAERGISPNPTEKHFEAKINSSVCEHSKHRTNFWSSMTQVSYSEVPVFDSDHFH